MSFKILDPKDFILEINSVAAPAWSDYSASLTSFYTSSIQLDFLSGLYYMNVYNSNLISSISEIQFSLAYGDMDGSGSLWYTAAMPGKSPTKTIYKQFVNLLLGEDENTFFNFGTSTPATEFFVITINRDHYKQAILPGSLQIRGLTDPDVYITDNSTITSSLVFTNAGRRYALGSGSFGDGIMVGKYDSVYGYLYPDIGIILLNPRLFKQEIKDKLFTGGKPSNINSREYNEILIPYITQFTLQSEEIIPSTYVFCRARNDEFNFSTQPNFISSTRNLTSSLNNFVETPPTYITTVGLYNDNNELLAVAKLSKPLKKDFTLEALIRVKLDF
jgi:hypothetical protein